MHPHKASVKISGGCEKTVMKKLWMDEQMDTMITIYFQQIRMGNNREVELGKIGGK